MQNDLDGSPDDGSTAATPSDARLVALLDSLRVEAGAPGAILGVAIRDAPPRIVAAGLADRETGRPIEAGDPFFIGSVSKTWPVREEMIRLITGDWTRDEALELAGRFGHWFDPGTDWSYCSANYFILGVIVEGVSGLTLAQAYRHSIDGPLGIGDTWLTWHEAAAATLPTGYLGPVDGWSHSAMFGELGATTVLDRSPIEWGAGGLASTAADGLRFLRGVFAGKLLSPASIDAMTTFRDTPPLGVTDSEPQATAGPDGYGLGVVRMRRPDFTLIGHGGLFTGHTAGMWYLPDCDIAIVLYFNRGFINQRTVLDRVWPLLAGETRAPGPCRPAPGAARGGGASH